MQQSSTTKTRKLIWINPAQSVSAQNKSVIQTHKWGRGTGKTTLIGIKTNERFRRLPRALFFLSSTTYHQILSKSLPPILNFLNDLGFREYDWKERIGHYVVCIKPPAHFEKPYKAPRKYDYVITFYNGFSIELLSMDRPDLARGGNYDGGDIDEAALVEKDDMQKVLLPAVRGGKDKFSDPLHGQKCLYTSAPWLSKGMYILDYKEKAKEDSAMFYWSEATAHINLKVLGPNWIKEQQATLDPRIFRLEIMNENMIKTDSMFYHKFDDKLHVYQANYTYSFNDQGVMYTDRSSDYNSRQLLDVAFDLGGWFNCCLVFQSYQNKGIEYERCINSFHVKENVGIDALVDMLCSHYAGHRTKIVRMWGEPRGTDKTPNPMTHFEQIEARFIRNGWQVESRVMHNKADTHEVRHQYLNELLAENTEGPRIRFNQDNCKDPIVAIQMTGVTPDMKKDKSNERDRAFSQEHATHYTDAMDYYFMQKYFQQDIGMGCSVW